MECYDFSWHKHVLFDHLWLYYWRLVDFGAYTLTQINFQILSVQEKMTSEPKNEKSVIVKAQMALDR